MNLFPTFRFGDLDLASYPFAVRFGKDLGSPEQVVAEVRSALRHGSMTEVDNYTNREVSIPVMVQGADFAELAEAEALLVAEAMKARNEFIFNPGDGFAADSVYDTYEAQLTPEYDDNYDLNLVRLYTLTFAAHPWPRSAQKVITDAVGATTPTVVNDGSSTAGWSIPRGGGVPVLSSSGGAVISTYDASTKDAGQAYHGTDLLLTTTIDATTTKFIGVTWKSSITVFHSVRLSGVPVNLVEVRRDSMTSGYVRSWYKVDDAVTSVSSVLLSASHLQGTGSATLSIDKVELAETLPNTGTDRQLTRVIDPTGSIPAEGDVIVQHPTAGLGQTIVYSHPASGGYSPPLRPWKADGLDPVTPDASYVSGATNLITNPCDYRIPVDAIPEGDVQLWARLYSETAGTIPIYWGSHSWMGGTLVGVGKTDFTEVTWTTAHTWVVVPLARLTLPANRIGPAGYHQVGIRRWTGSTANVYVDEAWLFAMDVGRLTVLDCGTGTPAAGSVHNRLRVSAPTLEAPFGRIAVATAADWSDSFAPNMAKVLCDQTGHKFDPQGSSVLVVTSGATDASVSFEHYPRWHSSAGGAA